MSRHAERVINFNLRAALRILWALRIRVNSLYSTHLAGW